MQEAKTIARPYTTAIFEIASGTGQFEGWEKFINALSDVVDNPDFKSVQLGAISGALDLSDFLINFISEVYGEPEVHPQVESYNGNVNTMSERSRRSRSSSTSRRRKRRGSNRRFPSENEDLRRVRQPHTSNVDTHQITL